MEEFVRFKKEFKSLVLAVRAASLSQDPININRYALVLYDEIKDIPVTTPLEVEDIEQELKLYWFIFVEKYHQSKPEITLRQYLLRRSIWALRDWYRWSMKPSGTSIQKKYSKEEFPFKLDVHFLIRGCDVHPFSLLSPYQRYILYLRYKEKKSITKISKLVIKTRKTVSLELRRIIKFLRSEAKNAATKNTR